MTIIRATAHIDIDTRDSDPEEVCAALNRGLESAIAHFPDGDVLGAKVCTADELTAEQISEEGYDEA